jgi:uncharacterized protein (TIGR03382 family)
MKTLILIVAFVFVLAPATVNAQDWVMDWTSRGSSVGILTGPFSEGWNISGTSPAVLTPLPSGLPINFSAPAYNLGFTWEGRNYGGPVSAQTNFQSIEWKAPVPCAGIFSSCTMNATPGFASGSFAFTDPNHFTVDVLVGSAHSHTELVGVGHRAGVTASAPEPATMAVGGIGLLVAALLRRRRMASSPMSHDA